MDQRADRLRAVKARRLEVLGGARPASLRGLGREAETAVVGRFALPLFRVIARGLLAKLGPNDEARAEFERAAAMTRNEREWELLRKRANSMGGRTATK